MGKRLIGSVGLEPGTDTGFDLDEKGQIHGYSDTQFALPVGDDDTILTADSGEASGIKWAVSSGLSSPLTSNLVFNDNISAAFGTSGTSDSAIYHDGSNLNFGVSTGVSIFDGSFTMGSAKTMTNNRSTRTIASGAITGNCNVMSVDTEGAASTDDLEVADFTAAGQTGAFFGLTSASGSRTVVIKANATPNPKFLMSGDFSLDNPSDFAYFSAVNGLTHNYGIAVSNNA